ncbi:MAG: VWA-like domain-containing protein [Treponema sp.]|nr:VWA-like domain-containing protein [Treponema sp.]
MSVKETISRIVDKWFLYEPLLFNIYCTHKLEENTQMECPFRTGKGRIEYNPKLLKDASRNEVENGLKAEVTRIILKHPYQRVPKNPNRSALKTASDVTINEHCYSDKGLRNAEFYNLEQGLSFEEYYKKLYYICPNFDAAQWSENGMISPSSENGEIEEYQAAADASELWDEDEEIVDTVNQQIEKAMKTNQWGSVSGDFQEMVTASLKVPMDYRRILSQFRANIISQRRYLTRMKPNRRYGFEFMGSKFEPKTHLLVAVDVSGSVSSQDLNRFFSIINRFFSYGVEEIKVIAFDSKINQIYDLKKASKEIKVLGRGGTNFQPAVNYYEEHSEYQGMIIFTDGYADPPEIKKNKQILWILTSKVDYDYAKDWIKNLRQNKATWIPQMETRENE